MTRVPLDCRWPARPPLLRRKLIIDDRRRSYITYVRYHLQLEYVY